ncbi:hypothetical protein AcV5_007140 [Taiwanofungus camphoratus]|nr:hypothetical protein AcV5_007140 [Antrodia cinnamomea]
MMLVSSDSAPRTKRSAPETMKITPEDDHRRKRRNRTTQSCLNCHTSKRMCDRKRPCGRCIQLGLTGLCVYEVDDPKRSNDSEDEKSRLQKRVAELESVIRELKNKPHPRWVHLESITHDSPTPGDKTQAEALVKDTQPQHGSPKPDSRNPRGSTSNHLAATNAASSRLSPSPSVPESPSPIDTPSPQSFVDMQFPATLEQAGVEPDFDLAAVFSAYQTEQMGMHSSLFADTFNLPTHTNGACNDSFHADHCGCLNDPANYNVILELSLRLRKAADILGRSFKHGSSASSCALNRRIVELDRFTTTALGNIHALPESFSSYSGPDCLPIPTASLLGMSANASLPSNFYETTAAAAPASGPTLSPLSLQTLRTCDLEMSTAYPSPPWEDSFMSWAPRRH